jgi:tetratricopeptide (TPR) repeat protein
VEGWIDEDPQATRWRSARHSVLVLAGREAEAVELAEAGLDGAMETAREVMARRQALLNLVRQDPTNAELDAEVVAIERELEGVVNRLEESRSEFIRASMEAAIYAPAERRLREWLAELPEAKPVRTALVELLLSSGKPQAALDELGAFTPQGPQEVRQVLSYRARCHAAKGDVELALRELTQLLAEPFIQSNPLERSRVRAEIVQILRDAGEFTRAVRLCDRWLDETTEAEPLSRVEVLMLKRAVLQSAEREAETIAVTEALLDYQPNEPGWNNDLGYTWVDRGEHLERSLGMIRLAVAAEPLNPAYLDSLGWAYYKLGRFEAAREQLDRATRLRLGQDPVVFDHLGDAAYRVDDRAAAERAWRRSLALLEEMDPDALTAVHSDLMVRVRGKLASLVAGERVQVSPTGDEREAEESQ